MSYRAAYDRGAALTYEAVAPTLMGALDDLFDRTDAPTTTVLGERCKSSGPDM
jgi:hypothetical protein